MFNCDAVTRKLVEEGDPGPYFFSTPKLNFIVVFKETIAAGDTRRDRRHHSVGTKLMFPSDTHFTDKGGPSIYLHDTKLVTVLREVIGADEGDDLAALNRDLTILRTLDRLPSFDPFLTQDALENAGVAPNRHYFAVPESEHRGIREFIRRKFDPLVRRALDGQEVSAAKSILLANKLWEANDARALAPLAQAFRFPGDDALAIFSAWKSINIYCFRYVQTKPTREAFALWLRDQAQVRDLSDTAASSYIRLLRRDVMTRLRHHWRVVEEITREHERLYGELLRSPQAVAPFIAFLGQSRVLGGRMGLALSKIDHAVRVWRAAMEFHPLGVMPNDVLKGLLLLNDILIVDDLSETEPAAAPAMAKAS